MQFIVVTYARKESLTMMLAFSLVSDGLVVQRAAAPIAAPRAASRATMPSAGLFDLFKESPEDKARKDAEFKEIQEMQRRRLDPNAMDDYKAQVEERRLEQMAKRKDEEAVLTSANVEVVGFAEKGAEDELPGGWTAVKDAEGDTYYVRCPCPRPLLTISWKLLTMTLTDRTPLPPICAVEQGDRRHAVGGADERVGVGRRSM